MEYFKAQNDNFNYWTGTELKKLFGLDYTSETVKNTPQYLLDGLYKPSDMKKEAKKMIRKTKRTVKKKVKKAVRNHQKAKAKKAKQKAKQAAKKGTGNT